MEIKIGTGVTENCYSDSTPWEVIRVVSPITLEIRAMKAEGGLKKNHVFIPGGFVGYVVDQHSAQEWKLSSDPEGEVIRIRLNKKGRWKLGKYRRFSVGTAHKFYDYNF